MYFVPEHELQGVLAWRELDFRFRLAFTKMDHVFRGWKRHIHTGELVEINEQVMMSRIRNIDTCRSDPHSHEAKANARRRLNSGSILRRYDVGLSPFGRRRFREGVRAESRRGCDDGNDEKGDDGFHRFIRFLAEKVSIEGFGQR